MNEKKLCYFSKLVLVVISKAFWNILDSTIKVL